jgi:hypothetical protein
VREDVPLGPDEVRKSEVELGETSGDVVGSAEQLCEPFDSLCGPSDRLCGAFGHLGETTEYLGELADARVEPADSIGPLRGGALRKGGVLYRLPQSLGEAAESLCRFADRRGGPTESRCELAE